MITTSKLIVIYITFALLIAQATAKCSLALLKSNTEAHISCSNITIAEYTSELHETIIPLIYGDAKGYVEELSIDLRNSHLPVVDKRLLSPLAGRFSRINTIKIINSSVEEFHVKPYQSGMVRKLNLSGNNISDFRFLSRMRFLRELDLSYGTFRENTELDKYLKSNQQPPLDLLKVKRCNLKRFTVTDSVRNYDLSFNRELSLVHLNHSAYVTPFVNLSHNDNDQLKFVSVNSKCFFALDVSHSRRRINSTNIFNNRICRAQEIFLNNNVLPYLVDNATFVNLRTVMEPPVSFRSNVYLSNTNLTDVPAGAFNSIYLNTLSLSYNNLASLQGSVFNNSFIHFLLISNCNITFIDAEAFTNLQVNSLDISHNKLSSLKGVFRSITSIFDLDVSHNPIEALNEEDFLHCEGLHTLNLANVPLKTINGNPMMNLQTLTILTLTLDPHTNITALKNHDLTQLVIINSSLDNLKAGHFKDFYSLTSLTFSYSYVKEIDKLALQGLYQLTEILITKELGSYDASIFQNLYSLEVLDLSKHQIKKLDLELRDLLNLKSLNLSFNHLVSLHVNSFENLISLETLSLQHNQISNIPVGTFRGLTSLTHLYLNNNQLQLLAPGTFSNLDDLVLLDLSDNILLRTKPHLVFGFSMPQLNTLCLQGNQLGYEYTKGEDLVIRAEFSALANHKSLKFVNINRNGWHCMTLADVLGSLRNKNISYRPTKIDDLQSVNIDGVTCTMG